MITVKVESRNSRGEIVGLVETPAQSLVHNFLRVLRIQMNQAAATVQTIAGNWISPVPYSTNYMATVGENVDGRGIVVGTVADPVTIHQSTLHGRIPHGTVGGQLLYKAVTFVAPTETASLFQFQMSRVFMNRSGVAATIVEVGIYSDVIYGTVMIDRTVLPSPVVVPDGGQVTIVYTFRGTLG